MKAKHYRLIWFQHFHKAAGTTIVNLARKNGERLYSGNINGSPVDQYGNSLPVWSMNGTRLSDFVDHCQEQGCTFVGPEWGVGDLETLSRDPRVVTVTCVREPYERFVSNYIFDFRLGYTSSKDIEQYVGSKRSFSRFNYYTHMLARIGEDDSTISSRDFLAAKQALEKFDYVGIVGAKNWLRELCSFMNWRPRAIQANKRRNVLTQSLRHLVRGRPRVAKRTLDSARLVIDEGFRERFERSNEFDYEIYRLSQSHRCSFHKKV